MENLKLFLILLCVLAVWVMKLRLMPEGRRRSKRTSSRVKYRSLQDTSVNYHNKHFIEGESSLYWRGGSADPNICQKVRRKRRESAYKNGC